MVAKSLYKRDHVKCLWGDIVPQQMEEAFNMHIPCLLSVWRLFFQFLQNPRKGRAGREVKVQFESLKIQQAVSNFSYIASCWDWKEEEYFDLCVAPLSCILTQQNWTQIQRKTHTHKMYTQSWHCMWKAGKYENKARWYREGAEMEREEEIKGTT